MSNKQFVNRTDSLNMLSNNKGSIPMSIVLFLIIVGFPFAMFAVDDFMKEIGIFLTYFMTMYIMVLSIASDEVKPLGVILMLMFLGVPIAIFVVNNNPEYHQTVSDIYENNTFKSMCVIFLYGFTMVWILIAAMISKAADVTDKVVCATTHVVKEVWKETNMNEHILNGIGTTIYTALNVYEGFKKCLTKDIIRNWFEINSFTRESLVVIEKESLSIKEYIVTCKVYDAHNNLSGQVHWKCQEIEYELEQIIGRTRVKTILS